MTRLPPAPDRSTDPPRPGDGRVPAVAREILRIAREELKLEGEAPAPDEPLAERLDSMALLALVVAVEDRFRVALTDDDAVRARSVEDLARIVAGRADPALLGDLPGGAA